MEEKMEKSFNTLGLQTLLGFPFKDKRGVSKFLIAALFLIFSGFIVPALFLLGWYMRIAKNVMVTKTLGDLPEWDEWGHMILDGLKLVGVVLIYFLPVMVLFPISLALGFIPVIGWISGGILSWLTYLFAMALTVFVIPAILNMIDKGSFGAAFHFKEWWENLKVNFAGYLVVYLIVAGVYALLALILGVVFSTVILLCLVPVVIIAVVLYISMISYAVLGQVWVEGEEKLASARVPVPTVPVKKVAAK
jgi:hypothetical protein